MDSTLLGGYLVAAFIGLILAGIRVFRIYGRKQAKVAPKAVATINPVGLVKSAADSVSEAYQSFWEGGSTRLFLPTPARFRPQSILAEPVRQRGDLAIPINRRLRLRHVVLVGSIEDGIARGTLVNRQRPRVISCPTNRLRRVS